MSRIPTVYPPPVLEPVRDRTRASRSLSELVLPTIALDAPDSKVAAVDARTRELMKQCGILASERDESKKFERCKSSLLSVLAYPDADVEQATLVNDFHAYLFHVDDQAEEDENYGKRPELLRHYFASHVLALRHGRLAWDADPAGQLLLSLRERLLAASSEEWIDRFANDVEEYLLRGTLRGAEHWTAGSVPTLEEYERQRGFDSSVYACQDMIEICGGHRVDADLFEADDFAHLRKLCTRVVAFVNDLVSYTKEVVRHASPNNLLHVMMVEYSMSLDDAITASVELINRDCAEYESLSAAAIEAAGARRREVQAYVRGQRAWMRGNLQWSLATRRYEDPLSPFVELRGQRTLYAVDDPQQR